MNLRTLKDIKKFHGVRVLLRVGMDLPLSDSKKVDDISRIALGLPTIKYLIQKKAVTIIVNHFGRPENSEEYLRNDIIAKKLSALLKKKVKKLDAIHGKDVDLAVKNARPGEVLMLENIRFDKGEKKNDLSLSKKLASLADIYVNDAFSNSHRNHSSMVGVTHFLPSYAGLTVEKEARELSAILENPKRPLLAIIGGAKAETKLGVIKTFLNHADNVLVGGALANTILKAKGVSVGKSMVDDEKISEMKKVFLTNVKLHLPVDVAVGNRLNKKVKAVVKAAGNVSDHEYILDIGRDTIKLYESAIKKAKTIVWNGPLGLIEYPEFREGTKRIIESLLKSKAKVIIGGGDSIKVVNMFAKKDVSAYRHIYVSSGGGAMLKFFENSKLPALVPLIKK